MAGERTVLGVNRTQDASICVLSDASVACSTQKERLTRTKHHWGQLDDFRNWYMGRVPELRRPIDLVVECYSSDPEIARIAEYHDELRDVIDFRGEPRIVCVSHHLAHLYGTFPLAPRDQTSVMVIDFQGSRAKDILEDWPGRNGVEPHCVEVSSFYHCYGGRIRCLGKQLWDEDRRRPKGLGCFYHLMTQAMFPGEGNEGKVMGLAPYGDPDALGLPGLLVRDGEVIIPEAWIKIINDRGRFRHFVDGSGSFEECADLAASGQRCFEDALLQLAQWLFTQAPSETLCFAGGTALNCVANGRLLRESPFKDILIPPSPHDGGTALGCAIFGLTECLGAKSDFRWVDDFLGPEPSPIHVPQLVAGEEELRCEEPTDLLERITKLIASGRVVGLYRGRSELGPRALGHRSILADPRRQHVRTWINQHVKGRELFRPLAPVVLEEAAPRFFEIDRPSPFMQFASSVLPEQREVIPAVTHVDGTARIQTVNERNDPFLYALLKAFENTTGVGVLLNTSFNGKGEPIVETLREAVNCFKATPMHVLAVPPWIICKKDEPGIPR